MIKKLTLETFKNFRRADLFLGPFTLLVGTNASGKSNIRDAFRFLHGLSRGYNLADIMGEKWIEGGVLQWRGIRGGTREAVFQGSDSFTLTVDFDINDKGQLRDAQYQIKVNVGTNGAPPRVSAERLVVNGRGSYIFESSSGDNEALDPQEIMVQLRKEAQKGFVGPSFPFPNNQPIISQIPESKKVKLAIIKEFCREALSAFSSMRFLDLSPDQMRIPSLPGQKILGDRGENLSSVLQAICSDDKNKQSLVQWIKELTPMDAVDFEFPPDQTGKILVSLVEQGGRRISAYSASDGTLRFLAMIAALIGPEPAKFYFFEELENGIHPTRLHLLMQLIESKTVHGSIQVVASSHSPQLLAILSPSSLRHTSLVFRLENDTEARIKGIWDIPNAKEVIGKQDIAKLLSSGWLEDAVAFTAGEGLPS